MSADTRLANLSAEFAVGVPEFCRTANLAVTDLPPVVSLAADALLPPPLLLQAAIDIPSANDVATAAVIFIDDFMRHPMSF
ncbi:MAG TPA: hypothetical protein VGJ19_19060 [Streptosporangiaceae bacterium]